MLEFIAVFLAIYKKDYDIKYFMSNTLTTGTNDKTNPKFNHRLKLIQNSIYFLAQVAFIVKINLC